MSTNRADEQGICPLSSTVTSPLGILLPRAMDPLARRASDQIPIFDIMNRPLVFLLFSPAPRSLEFLRNERDRGEGQT